MQHDPDIFSVINFRLHDIAITDINHQTLPSFSHAAEWRMNSSQAVEWHSERVRHCITECFFFEVSEINSSNFWCFLNAHKLQKNSFPAPATFRVRETILNWILCFFSPCIYLFDLIVDSISTFIFFLGAWKRCMRSSINLKVNEVSFECFQKGELLIKSVYCIAMMYDGSVLFVNEPFMIQSMPSSSR